MFAGAAGMVTIDTAGHAMVAGRVIPAHQVGTTRKSPTAVETFGKVFSCVQELKVCRAVQTSSSVGYQCHIVDVTL
jgi:hypothetical protein